MEWLFYQLQTDQMDRLEGLSGQKGPGSPHRVTVHLWKPSRAKVRPPHLPIFPFGVWWLFHQLRVFTTQDYCVLLIFDGSLLVHRSCAFPRYFRFPFMGKIDLQIGDTWTHPEHRGQGLATYATYRILQLCNKAQRSFWYLVPEDNVASIRVVEKVGFTRVGRGCRKRRWGLSTLGTFSICVREGGDGSDADEKPIEALK